MRQCHQDILHLLSVNKHRFSLNRTYHRDTQDWEKNQYHHELQEAKHPSLRQGIVPDTEHLTVVHVGLDQAFAWMQSLLDQRAK